MFPRKSVTLDGSNSSALEVGGGGASDRGEGRESVANGIETPTIVSFHWTFVSFNGKASAKATRKKISTTQPAKTKDGAQTKEIFKNDVDVKIVSPDKPKTMVEGLTRPGKYVFELAIADDKKHTAKDKVYPMSR